MKRTKNVLIGVVIGLMLSYIPTFGQAAISAISVKLNAINVQLEGEPVDVNSILYQGSTYLPMRKVAELVGKNVEWEAETMTANITKNITMEDEEMNVQSIIETHISANDVVLKVGITENHDLLVLRDIDGKLLLRIVKYIDNKKGRMGEYVTVLDNIPYVIDKGMAYIPKDYYEQTILPLINQR